MERLATTELHIGAWRIQPATGQISLNGETAKVEARTMRLLLCLAERGGQVVSIDDLLNQVWPDVAVSQDSVYQAIASLRRILRDDPKQPAYIETVPRLGYRMVAKVSPWEETADLVPAPQIAPATMHAPQYGLRRQPGFTGNPVRWIATATLCLILLALSVVFLVHQRASKNNPIPATQPQKSIAVLPFLDLTQGMTQEEFADGMTEELIDKLSKIPGLQVPPPTSSFYFKGKQIPVAEIAKSLGVAYILDGSVRKSGSMVRIAARLIRADNGYIVWTETYDRPFTDLLWVQDDIAGEATKALQSSIQAAPTH
jgi:TolB-like protein/DNA-binding winged helix-turn-helix (wHTH) protein